MREFLSCRRESEMDFVYYKKFGKADRPAR